MHYLASFTEQEYFSNIRDNPKILCLGCSFTSGSVFTPGSWPYLMTPLIGSFDILNGGKGGAGTWYQYHLADSLTKTNPNVVVFQLMGPERNPIYEEEKEGCEDGLNRPMEFTDPIKKLSQAWKYPCARIIWPRISVEKVQSSSRRMKEIILQDFDWVRKTREKYSCPFVYLVNDQGYPYYDDFDFAMKHLHANDDYILITNFKDDDYRLPHNGHPNFERLQMTAELVVTFLEEKNLI